MNIGGASDRPVLTEVWENAKAQLEGKEVPQKDYSTTGALKFVKQKVLGS